MSSQAAASSSASGSALSWRSSTALVCPSGNAGRDQPVARHHSASSQWRDGHLQERFLQFQEHQSYSGTDSETASTHLARRLHLGGLAPRRPLRRWFHRARRDPRRIRPLCGRVEEAESAHRKHSIRKRRLVPDRIQRSREDLRRSRRPHHLSSEQVLSMAFCRRADPFPSICAIAKSCGKAGFSRSSPRTRL